MHVEYYTVSAELILNKYRIANHCINEVLTSYCSFTRLTDTQGIPFYDLSRIYDFEEKDTIL